MTMHPKKRTHPRDAAVSFQLPEGSGPMTTMCSLGDLLEIYTADATYTVHSPDTTDPARTNPKLPWVIVKTDDMGSASPVIARTFLTAYEALKLATLAKPIDKDEVLRHVYGLKGTLVQCAAAVSRFEAEVAKEVAAVEATGLKRQRGHRAVEQFPVVGDLDAHATAILIPAKRAIREVCGLIARFWPLKKAHSRLDKAIAEFRAIASPPDQMLLEWLAANLQDAERIVDLRNFQEHADDNKRLNVENFKLVASGQIMPPVWYLTGEKPMDMVSEARSIVQFLTTLAEHTIVGSIDARRADFPPVVFRIDENPPSAVPIRYVLVIDTSKLKFDSSPRSNKCPTPGSS